MMIDKSLQLVNVGSVGGHFLNWHTRDSQTTETVVSPLLARLVYNAVMLPLHALVSGAFAFLAEVGDRVLGRLNEINHDFVVRVLDCCDCHGCLALTLLIYTVLGCCAGLVDTLTNCHTRFLRVLGASSKCLPFLLILCLSMCTSAYSLHVKKHNFMVLPFVSGSGYSKRQGNISYGNLTLLSCTNPLLFDSIECFA